MTRNQEWKRKRKREKEFIQKAIKHSHIIQQKAEETIANFKITLKNELNMSRTWIKNTVQWLMTKAE